MLFEFFALNLIFWLVLATVGFLDLFLFWNDDSEGLAIASVLTIATVVVVALFSPVFVHVSAQLLVIGGIGYVFTGIIWSFKEWYDFLKDALASTVRFYPNGVWEKATDTDKAAYLDRNRPQASHNKGRITGWMVLWPIYFSWWILTLPRHFYTWVYENLVVVYDNFAKRVFS